MVLEKVESNIRQIITLCLHELISSDCKSKSPSHCKPTDITRHFPSNMNVSEVVTVCGSAGWQINNAIIECSFGLKVVFKQKSDALRFMHIVGDSEAVHGQTPWHSLFQPADIATRFAATQIPAEWKRMDSGILCRFRPLNQWHEFAVIPFVSVSRFDLELFNKTESAMDDVECLEQDEKGWNEWYYEQYMDYYGVSGSGDDAQKQEDKTVTVVDTDCGDDIDCDEDLDLDIGNVVRRDRKRRFCGHSSPFEGDGDSGYDGSRSAPFSPCKRRRVSEMTVYS